MAAARCGAGSLVGDGDRPPCSWTTQRAMARPRPVPPSVGGRRVVNRSNTALAVGRRRCPGPRRRPRATVRSPAARRPRRDRPPAGLCRTALSSRLATQLVQPVRGRPCDREVRRVDPDDVATRRRRVSRASATASSSRSATATSLAAAAASTPPSTRDRSSRSLTSRPSRSVWASAARSVAGSGGATPSTRFSSTACSAEIGVRSSCETLATSSRRCRSTAAEVGRHRVERPGQLADLVARRRA